MKKVNPNSKQDPKAQVAKLGVVDSVIPGLTNINYASSGIPGFSDLSLRFPVNHYEVALSVDPELTSSSDLISENSGYIVNIGGRAFHRQVIAAADYARANYLVTQGVGTSETLVQAFYDILLNSRTIYGLLLAAHRCQNMVNCVDEDNIFINYLFATRSAWAPISSSIDPYLQVQTSTYTTRSNRQALCFSSAMSNAEWKGMWEQAQTCLYLPTNWKRQLEHLFSGVFACLPTKGASSPTFVTLWPSAFITSSSSAIKSGVTFLENYYSKGTGLVTSNNRATQPGNSTLTQLQSFINTFVARVSYLKGQFPELELMFKYLGIDQEISFNFMRDLSARTIKVDYTTEIAEVIYNASLPHWFLNPDFNLTNTGFFSGRRLTRTLEDCFLNLDPVFVSQTRSLVKALKQDANFVFQDAKSEVSNQALSLILYNAMAPLGVRWLKRQNGISNFLSCSLGRIDLSNMGYFINAMINGNCTVSQVNNYCGWSLFNDTESYVLPRKSFQIYISGASWSVSDQFFMAGLPAYTTTNKYYLRDYLVPQMTAQDVMLDALDKLCASVNN